MKMIKVKMKDDAPKIAVIIDHKKYILSELKEIPENVFKKLKKYVREVKENVKS